jgi:NADH:ubiquinone oxidoreductase subunit 4 (subunit M)
VMWMGVYPAPVLDVMSVSVDNLLAKYHAALAAPQAAMVPDLAARAVAWLK